MVGIAGAEYGIRGFIDAYDAATGKRAWRFWTVPGPGEKGSETWEGDSWERGGGSTWVTGTYDPALNLIYWGTGNPGPDLYGNDRDGDNLYTDSVVALDADTGTLKWYYQFTPHDVHDWDATQVPVLGDKVVNGVPRKVLMFANRNGFFYTLDRTDGKIIASRSFVKTTWAEKINPDGKPAVLPNTSPTEDGNDVCPDITGGTNWMSPAYNPKTGLFYVTAREVCATYYGWEQEFVQGQYYFGGAAQRTGGRGFSALRAIDPVTAGDEVGVQVLHAVDGRHAVNRFRSRLRRGHGRQRDGVRRDEREEPLALPDRLVDLGGADHLHARRTSVHRDAVGHDAVRVRAAVTAVAAQTRPVRIVPAPPTVG